MENKQQSVEMSKTLSFAYYCKIVTNSYHHICIYIQKHVINIKTLCMLNIRDEYKVIPRLDFVFLSVLASVSLCVGVFGQLVFQITVKSSL